MTNPRPLLFTTWSFGPTGNVPAFPALARGGDALDAAVHATTLIEDDASIDSVGVGGLPDYDGRVSLDACVMTDPNRAGAVAFVRRYANTAQIARRVMEKTIHVTLVGEGAEEFAAKEGFTPRELLTPEARAVWQAWRNDPGAIDRDKYKGWIPPRNVEELRGSFVKTTGSGAGAGQQSLRRPEPHHDTVGVLAMDVRGRLAGVCSTSGMAFKVPGRVGDSPIIGQGLYVDQEAGAACATGTGEIITGVCGSFLIVELLRRGATPADAIRETLERIRRRFTLADEHQTAFLALDTKGGWASGALRPGFHHTITDESGTRVEDPTFVLMP